MKAISRGPLHFLEYQKSLLLSEGIHSVVVPDGVRPDSFLFIPPGPMELSVLCVEESDVFRATDTLQVAAREDREPEGPAEALAQHINPGETDDCEQPGKNLSSPEEDGKALTGYGIRQYGKGGNPQVSAVGGIFEIAVLSIYLLGLPGLIGLYMPFTVLYRHGLSISLTHFAGLCLLMAISLSLIWLFWVEANRVCTDSVMIRFDSQSLTARGIFFGRTEISYADVTHVMIRRPRWRSWFLEIRSRRDDARVRLVADPLGEIITILLGRSPNLLEFDIKDFPEEEEVDEVQIRRKRPRRGMVVRAERRVSKNRLKQANGSAEPGPTTTS